jgi:hypothetical protein
VRNLTSSERRGSPPSAMITDAERKEIKLDKRLFFDDMYWRQKHHKKILDKLRVVDTN